MANSSSVATPAIPPVTSSTMSRSSPTTSLAATEDAIFDIIRRLLNRTDLYEHQVADYIEPEKYPVAGIHVMIWTFTVLTYLLAIPIAVRMFRSKAYLNIIDYFSAHIILCAFIAWFPAFIILIRHWSIKLTLRLCRFHFVLLSTNETVPLFFVLFMTIERFLYANPSLKQKCGQFFRMYLIYLYSLFAWLLTALVYALFAPFKQPNLNSPVAAYLANYCPYDYHKLLRLATVRSILYFCSFAPALILIGFVLKFFWVMRGTNQIPAIEKLWTLRTTALLCILVFYDVYLYYLDNILETYRSFLLSSMLRSTFYLVQLLIIACTDPYWLELIVERGACLCCIIAGRRRKARATPVPISTEMEVSASPFSSSAGHYSLVDDAIDDEFDRATNEPQPTLRIIP